MSVYEISIYEMSVYEINIFKRLFIYPYKNDRL